MWLTLAGLLTLSTFVSSPSRIVATSVRDQLTVDELMRGDRDAAALVDNDAFLPIQDAGPPAHEVEGRLTVGRVPLQQSTSEYRSYRNFPGFSVDFFTVDGHVVPVDRSLITTPNLNNWSLILSPGRIWSEPGDGGRSRASFPFVLGSPWDRLYSGGEVHNGVATFLVDDADVSDLRIQITQETAPDGDIFDMWGQVPLDYEPGPIADLQSHRADFERELGDRLTVRPWRELDDRFDVSGSVELTDGLPPDEISAAGLVIDGVVYAQPSRTRHGLYPFPAEMQHAAMSVSKSIGAGVAMLWLAEEFGAQVFELRIADYVEIDVDHNGWDDVTFGDVLDMATGVGSNAPDRNSFDVDANESGAGYERFYRGVTVREKLDAAFSAADYPWGPGEVLRYTSAQTFVLAAAMQSFLERREGSDTQLWDRLNEAVFEPIGVHHLTMIHVPDDKGGPGVPLLASGLRLTVDDLGKIVTLLQNGGFHDGRQLLHPALVEAALFRTDELAGLPSGKHFDDGDQAYQMSFWALPYRHRAGRHVQVPFMSGAGGSTVFLAPNGVTTFVFTDHGVDTYSLNSPAVAEAIRPYPDTGLDHVTLIGDPAGGFPVVTVVAIVAIVAAGAGIGALLVRRRRCGPGRSGPAPVP